MRNNKKKEQNKKMMALLSELQKESLSYQGKQALTMLIDMVDDDIHDTN